MNSTTQTLPSLGLHTNWKQFTLLVIVNVFVGAMFGLERSIFPEYAEKVFGITSATAILSFIIAFGISKAVTNYFTGKLISYFGRKRLLVIGWMWALPIPWLLVVANSWAWVVIANLLLGISQGLTWSSAVIMKIDLVGEKQRGLAMGFNEFAGYFAVGIVAWVSAWIATNYGIKPFPFYLGIGFTFIGLLLSWIWVKDTTHFVNTEAKQSMQTTHQNIFWATTWKDKNLGSITQAGFVNNLNDGMMWGLFPVFLANASIPLNHIGWIVALYPTTWGILQIFTGRLADILPKKQMLFGGMLLQGIVISLLPFFTSIPWITLLAILLGLGTAWVYPTFLAAIATYTHPTQRAESLGIFRFWRDMGYAIGALLSGIIADKWGVASAIFFIGIITIFSALIVQVRAK
ncbi:MAG: MFS transporter [Microscillaceae bacterium]|nr:MFS transporter [Microscillaceae bacterium]MDW8461427.1 MFS transporter [Cytophagales bacterium]